MPKKTAKAKRQPASQPGEGVRFEEALHKLETIVEQLEQADVPLESALKLYEEGVALARSCAQQLENAERRVELLEDKDGVLKGRPFAAASRTHPSAGDREEEAAFADDEEEDDEEDEETYAEDYSGGKKPEDKENQEDLF